MDISVIICTYNRFESLRRMLKSFTEIVNPEAFSWELIVVDNNSKDKTQIILEQYKKHSKVNLQYVFEEKQGLSRARNRGIQHAKGNIIAFTDDDIIVDKYWLFNIHKVLKEYQVSSVGGKILPLWDIPKPRWLIPELYGMLALLDLGEKPLYLNYPFIFGANIAVQAKMFKKYGLFNENLGRVGKKLFSHEELDFLLRLHNGGEKILYHPDILVHHCISRERMSKLYFRKWKYYAGASSAIMVKNVKRSNLGEISCNKTNLLFNMFLYPVNLMRFRSNIFICELKVIRDLSYFWHKYMVCER
jgi:glycosyltransferase involved in cell wall biosynthesis